MVVKIPMMPKGVEHRYALYCRVSGLKVKIPMMPKGVEHKLSDSFNPSPLV